MRIRLIRNLILDDTTIPNFISEIPNTLRQPYVLCGIHVTTLIASRRAPDALSLESADFVFADGYSIHLLGRVAGCTKSERIATTDLIHDILADTRIKRESSNLKIALIGGEPGIAQAASQNQNFILSTDQTGLLRV